MIEIKPIIAAIICFFTQDPLPIISETTVLNINFIHKEIIIEHEKLITAAGYEEQAKAALIQIDSLNSLDTSMDSLKLISKDFHEKDGFLNASIKVKFNSIKELEKIGFFVNAEGKLKYYKSDGIALLNENGVEKENDFIFEADKLISFRATPKFNGIFEKTSLLAIWKTIN